MGDDCHDEKDDQEADDSDSKKYENEVNENSKADFTNDYHGRNYYERKGYRTYQDS